MKTDGLGEFGRIARFFRPLADGFPGALGLTDDAAALAVPPGHALVVTTDAIVAGVHFLPDDPPDAVARKALRVNLSDLAAKGAKPYAYTLTLALGAGQDDSWVEAFARALGEDQALFGIALAGGDSVSTPGPIWMSVTAFGLGQEGRMVRRSGARAGDRILVTGTIGDAALGLAVLRGDLRPGEADSAFLTCRYRLPQPRVALAEAIAAHAHGALDVSDGLMADFGHLCRASGVRGVIEAGRIPLSHPARRALAAAPGLLPRIATGGDDYEVLLAAPPEAVAPLLAVARAVGIALTEIGRVEEGRGEAVLVDDAGAPIALDRAGWTHF